MLNSRVLAIGISALERRVFHESSPVILADYYYQFSFVWTAAMLKVFSEKEKNSSF
jgi:hypothetical protein